MYWCQIYDQYRYLNQKGKKQFQLFSYSFAGHCWWFVRKFGQNDISSI